MSRKTADKTQEALALALRLIRRCALVSSDRSDMFERAGAATQCYVCRGELTGYADAAQLLARAMDNDIDWLRSFTIDESSLPAPPQPGESWVDWNARQDKNIYD